MRVAEGFKQIDRPPKSQSTGNRKILSLPRSTSNLTKTLGWWPLTRANNSKFTKQSRQSKQTMSIERVYKGLCPQQVGTPEQGNPNDTVNTFLARILLPAPGSFFISCAGLLKGPTHISIVSRALEPVLIWTPFDCWHGNIIQVLDVYVSSTFPKCDRRRFSWIQFFFWILIWWCHFLWSRQSTPYLNWSKSSENKQNFSPAKRNNSSDKK